jgi:hypothetical protein
MSAGAQARRFVAFFCLVIVLLAALAPSSAGLPLAVLVPLYPFVAIAAILLLVHVDKQSPAPRFLTLPAFSPRPPPAR